MGQSGPYTHLRLQRHCQKRRPARSRHSQRSEEHRSELQSPCNLVCRLLLEKKNHTNETDSQTASGCDDIEYHHLLFVALHLHPPSLFLFFLIRHPPRSPPFPTRRSSDLMSAWRKRWRTSISNGSKWPIHSFKTSTALPKTSACPLTS